MRKLPPLSAIRVFEAAARLENFTGAAQELGMTQAAVSYQVRSLEERLRAPLFVREKGRVSLTPLGARLLPDLTQAFDLMDRAFAIQREDDELLLTVATTFTFANTWLAWRVGSFQLDHPDLAVRLVTGTKIVDLRAGEADVSIRAGKGPWEGVEATEILKVDFTPMCAPSFLDHCRARIGRDLVPSDLLSLPMLSPDDEWWDHWFAAVGVASENRPRRSGLRLDSQADEGHAAMGGSGFVLLNPIFWRNDLRDGRLVRPFEATATAGISYWLCVPPERLQVPKIKRFKAWIERAIAASAE